MLVKAVLVVVGAILVIGWIGSAITRRRPRLAKFCAACGRPIGPGPCPCGGRG